MIIKTLISLLLISLSFQSLQQQKLKFVIELFRHGARGTNHGKFLNNTTPHDNYIKGELTATGQRQHYNLGKYLKNRYIDEHKLLSKSMNFKEISVWSTNYNRTLMSAQSQLMGLYDLRSGAQIPKNLNESYLLPPNLQNNHTWHEKISSSYALPFGFDSLPIHTQIHKFNAMLNPTSRDVCPNYDIIKNNWKQEPQQKQTQQNLAVQFNQTAQQVSQILGQQVQVSDFYNIMENIQCDLNNGLPVPEQLLPGTPLFNQIKYVSDFNTYWDTEQPILGHLSNSDLLGTWIQYIENSLNNVSPLKMLFLSGHDSNFGYLLPALDLTSTQCITSQYQNGNYSQPFCYGRPKFAANLLVEVYQYSENDTIENAQIQMLLDGVNVPPCGIKGQNECSYQEFKARLQEIILPQQQFQQICFQNQSSTNQPEELQSFFNLSSNIDGDNFYLAIIILQTTGLIALSIALLQNRNNNNKQSNNNHQTELQYQGLITA